MAQMEPLNPFRTVVDLNGDWERYIHGKVFDVVSVPSSLRPSGTYRLQRTFLLPRLSGGQRAFVHFDAITYYGKVALNGHELGSMIPYLPHEFECTQQAIEGRNTIEVEIVDAHADQGDAAADAVRFANCGGWECYGGIIRPVYLELRAAAFIDSVRFAYQLDQRLPGRLLQGCDFRRVDHSATRILRAFALVGQVGSSHGDQRHSIASRKHRCRDDLRSQERRPVVP